MRPSAHKIHFTIFYTPLQHVISILILHPLSDFNSFNAEAVTLSWSDRDALASPNIAVPSGNVFIRAA